MLWNALAEDLAWKLRGSMCPGEAEKLLKDLCDPAFQSKFTTQYTYSVDDLIMWDNPTTMHSATPIAAAS